MVNYCGCMGLCLLGRLQSVGQLKTAASKILSLKKMHMISALVGKDEGGKDAT